MRLVGVDAAWMAMGRADHLRRVSGPSLGTNLGATDRVILTPGLTVRPVPTPGCHSGTGRPLAQSLVWAHPNRAALGKEKP